MGRLRISVLLFPCLAMLLVACGDLDMMLSSGKAYKVNARINGRSLDECAVLSGGSEISPYFDFNIKGDPDIASLVIYLKNYMGKEVGTRIKYTLPVKEDADGETGGQDSKSDPGVLPDAAGKDSGVNAAFLGETDTANGETPDSTVETMPNDEAPPETGSASVEDGGISTESETPIAGGSESVVDAPEPTPAPEEQVNVENLPETVIPVKNFYDLPPLVFGDDLPLGFYTIVFEVRTANGAVLNSVEKPFFYTAGNRLVIEEIVNYLPGVSSAARIVPPGEKIILETKILADRGITPYIVWYEGKKIISEGYVADGANRIFWSSPAQTGFQNIRVEVFPFNTNQMPVIRGLSHSVALPVSQRHDRDGYFSSYSNQLSHWYRLWGNLADTRDPVNSASTLVPAGDIEAQWQPVADTYGLKTGPARVYKIPGAFFKYIRQNEGSGEILFRFVPDDISAETLILKANLKFNDVKEAYPIELSMFEENLTLKVFVQDQVLQAQTPLIVDNGGFVSAAIDFQIFEENVVVSIGVEDTETASITTWEHLTIEGHTSGEGGVQFGGTFDYNIDEKHTRGSGFIITEIAVLYPETSPALPPPAEEENAKTETPEQEAAPAPDVKQ